MLEPCPHTAVTLMLNLQKSTKVLLNSYNDTFSPYEKCEKNLMSTCYKKKAMHFSFKYYLLIVPLVFTYPWWRPVSCRATSSQSSVHWPFLSQTRGAVLVSSSSTATSKEPLKFPYRYREKRICIKKKKKTQCQPIDKVLCFFSRRREQNICQYTNYRSCTITDLAGSSSRERDREKGAVNGCLSQGFSLSNLQKQEVPWWKTTNI